MLRFAARFVVHIPLVLTGRSARLSRLRRRSGVVPVVFIVLGAHLESARGQESDNTDSKESHNPNRAVLTPTHDQRPQGEHRGNRSEHPLGFMAFEKP